jgi:hypothetical protein
MMMEKREKAMKTRSEIVLEALRAKGKSETNGWLMVYLDNAKPQGMSFRAFAGHLSALEKAGLYRPVDGYAFGEVRAAA